LLLETRVHFAMPDSGGIGLPRRPLPLCSWRHVLLLSGGHAADETGMDASGAASALSNFALHFHTSLLGMLSASSMRDVSRAISPLARIREFLFPEAASIEIDVGLDS
jgi:hypothetical protein